MAVGMGAILIGILCFFFLAKGLWRFLGCMTTFVLMAVIVGVLFFFLSGSDIINNLSSELTSKLANSDSHEEEDEDSPETADQQMLQPYQAVVNTQEQQIPLVGLPPGAMQQQTPQTPPAVVTGKITSIVSGDVFRMGQHTIRLYGLASPLIDQKCLDSGGHTYDCGYVSARKLKDFVSGDDVTCRVMNINAQNELMAACSVGTFDIGAALVEAGWAIALPAVTPIYLPYQQKAQEGQKGMWEGRFQMPWEWMAQQQQMKERKPPKINIPRRSKKKGKSLLDYL